MPNDNNESNRQTPEPSPDTGVDVREDQEGVRRAVPDANEPTVPGRMSYWPPTRAVRQMDITAFLNEFIMLTESGTPILKSLKTLSERSKRAGLRRIVTDIAQHVEAGNPLWKAFERHPRYFDTVFVNLIKASEASGTLVPVLQRIVKYRERYELLRQKIRGGMVYPAILLLACFAVIIFISKVVMPQFEHMFEKFGQGEVPGLTRAFLAGTHFVDDWWWAVLLLILVLVIFYKLWWVRNPLRRLAADRLKLKLPILGPILSKNAVVEMARTLSLLRRSGLSMMITLELVRNVIHNQVVAEVINRVRDSVERGEGLEPPLRSAEDIIPPVVTDMLVTGEESGRLDDVSEKIADQYEEEVSIAIGSLGQTLQPVLTVLLGILIVLLMLAVFVPLVTMLDTLNTGAV